MKLCGFDVGLTRPFFLIAGPCVVESEQLQPLCRSLCAGVTPRITLCSWWRPIR